MTPKKDWVVPAPADVSLRSIAHRLSTVKSCDLVLVLDKGEVIEQGTHEELLSKKGRYWQLWEMQQGNFKIAKDKDKPQEIQSIEPNDEDEITY